MFFQIAFAICVVVIDTGSANPCKGTDKDIRNKITEYKEGNVEHCFFQLSVADEKNSLKEIEPGVSQFDKVSATKHCLRYKARLPQLTDGRITEFFNKKIAEPCKGDPDCSIFIGLTIKGMMNNGTLLNVKWDKGNAANLTIKGIYGTDKSIGPVLKKQCTEKMFMYVMNNGYWYCGDNFESKYNGTVFCHFDPTDPIATTMKPDATTPKGASPTNVLGSMEKVTVLATVGLVVYRMLPARMDE